MKSNQKPDSVVRSANLATIISTVIAISSLIFSYQTYQQSVAKQTEMEAYSFWLKYIELAANHPKFASGRHQEDTVTNNAYAWFVANALGAAEIVYHIQKEDNAWKKNIQTLIQDHKDYITMDKFNQCMYGDDFIELMEETLNHQFKKHCE